VSNLNGTTNGQLAPPADLMARAAEILGVDDTPGTLPAPGTTVMVTVAGPDRRQVMQVPTDVAMGRLAATLGEAVGVTVVSRVCQTLADVGARAGSIIFLNAAGGARSIPTAPRGGNGAGHDDSDHYQRKGTRLQPRTTPAVTPARTRTRWAGLSLALAALVAVSMLLGAALFGGASPTATSVPKSDQLLAARAAQAWVDGVTFSGPRLAGVPADLGRSGPTARGTVEAVGSSTSGAITSQLFVVAPTTGPVYGLSVVTYHGKVAYPPTVSPLPFAMSMVAGRPPVVPQTGTIVAPTAVGQAQTWAAAVFGSPTAPTGRLGYGVAGPVKILAQWVPKTGAALVTRVQVPLAGVLTGTAQAAALTAAQSTLTADTISVAAARTAVAAIVATVAHDQDQVTRTVAAAQVAVAAAATANPPNLPPLAAAVTAAQQAATDAQTSLSADQQTQTGDQSALAAAIQTQHSAAAAEKTAATVALTSVVSVYDVAYDTAGQAIAWSPADYLIGQH
jgi:hypothetical protein